MIARDKPKNDELSAAKAEMEATRAELEVAQAEVGALKAELEATRADLEATRADLETTRAELEATRAEAQANLERWARAQADFDNFRRRSRAEREEWSRYAAEELIREILPALDNLERALQADAGRESWTQGVELTLRQLLTTLQNRGLTPIESVDLPFDPNVHEAVMQVESDQHEEGTVVTEVRKGYKLGDKVIRPAMVGVARRS